MSQDIDPVSTISTALPGSPSPAWSEQRRVYHALCDAGGTGQEPEVDEGTPREA